MAARKQLLLTIDEQQEKINKYEARLTDLIRAYKGLTKEKTALQTALSAISLSSSSNEKSVTSENKVTDKVEIIESGTGFETDETKQILSLEERVRTLTQSLNSLSEEKNRAESLARDDRKRLVEEKKNADEELQGLSEKYAKLQEEFESKVKEMRSKIIHVQHEREQEALNGIIALREVETKLAKERSQKENIESLLEEKKSQNRKSANALLNQDLQQKQIVDLQNEIEKMQVRLEKAEQQCSDSSVMSNLHSQIEELKMHYLQAIQREQLLVEKAEASCREMSNVHEDRVASLESTLQDLSMTTADKDRITRDNLQTIQKLKNKIMELTDEKDSVSSKLILSDIDEHQVEFSTIQLFEELWNKVECKGEIAVLKDHLSMVSEIHENCHQSYISLRNEFDLFKMKIVERTGEDSCTCSSGLKKQVEELKEKLRKQISSTQMLKLSHSHQVDTLNQQIVSLKKSSNDSLEQAILDNRSQVASLEQQISEHCQRSLSTLQQRDEEIHALTQDLHRMSKEAKTQPSTIAAALISQVGSTASMGVNDGPLLHHMEEMARKQIELNQMSIEKRQLERTLREIQFSSVEKQEKMQDQIEDMREEVERYKRNMSREGFSNEYLKNVVVQYMTTTDSEARLSMANAISLILKFSPREISRIKTFLNQYWWQSKPPESGRRYLLSISDENPRRERTRKSSVL